MTAPDWTDVLRELSRFASDHELPRPLEVKVAADDHLDVSVSGPDHQPWFECFALGYQAVRRDGSVSHSSYGLLRSEALVSLHCLADDLLPSAVAS